MLSVNENPSNNKTPLSAKQLASLDAQFRHHGVLLREAALAYAEKGIPVFPCRVGAKEPASAHGFKDATCDSEQVKAWWEENPDYNIGLCPEGAGWGVVDLDPGAIRPELPETYEVETPRGGAHLYFKGSLPKTEGKLGDNIDTRGRGSYALAPPSIVNGKEYKIRHDRPLQNVPAEIVAKLSEPNQKQQQATHADVDTNPNMARARALIEGCVARGDVSIEGKRGDNRTYRLAAEVQALGISQETCLSLLEELWNPHCRPPFSHDELAKLSGNAEAYKQNETGAFAVGSAAEVFGALVPQEEWEIAEAPDANGFIQSGGLSFRSVQDIRPVEVNWLWPERIAAGKLTLIAGAPDGGKSQIAANIAATISNGGTWPFGEGKAEQGVVIWLSAEDDPADTTVPRLIAAGANRRLIFELKSVVRGDSGLRTFSVVEDLDEIGRVIEQIRATCGVPVKAIVIDPISAYMGGRAQGDSWKDFDVRHTMTPLLEFVARVGISTLGITHFKKGRDADVLNRVIDSIALPALSRATWLVAPEKDGEGNPTGRRLFLVGKKNIGRPVKGLAYHIREKLIDNGRGGTMPAPSIEWASYVAATADDALAEQTGKAAGKLEAAEDFLQLILADGPVSEKEIRKRAGEKHRWRTLQRAKEKLHVVSKKVDFDREWCWQLPGCGAPEDQGDEMFGIARAANWQESRYALIPSRPDKSLRIKRKHGNL